MKKITLTQGKFALIDDQDFEIVSQSKWYLSREGFAYSRRNNKSIALHRLIMSYPKGLEIDHISGDRLDNRRVNLRICTRAENQANRPIAKNNFTGYKGISLNRTKKAWRSRISVEGKEIHLGSFKTKEEAALAYNQAARRYYGGFARLNILATGN